MDAGDRPQALSVKADAAGHVIVARFCAQARAGRIVATAAPESSATGSTLSPEPRRRSDERREDADRRSLPLRASQSAPCCGAGFSWELRCGFTVMEATPYFKTTRNFLRA